MKKGKITRNRKPYDTGAIYLRMTPIQQLNYFRDLYYDNGNLTERCIIANAINDILLQYYRQAAEIEEYQKCIKEICKGIHETKALVAHDIQKARTEAIKEFAERLKKKAYPFPCATGVEYAVTIQAINDLGEEMTGGQ